MGKYTFFSEKWEERYSDIAVLDGAKLPVTLIDSSTVNV